MDKSKIVNLFTCLLANVSVNTLEKRRRGLEKELTSIHLRNLLPLWRHPKSDQRNDEEDDLVRHPSLHSQRIPCAEVNGWRKQQTNKQTNKRAPIHDNLPVIFSSDTVVENSDLSPYSLYSACSNMYRHFKIVPRACSKCQLYVLQAIYISGQQPGLCI